ncbi:MAG: porphobilinogen synthase [Thermoflexus hugenholtzii]|jgi:porphobilinogen synthase|uniref:porphobilinogen synthase n=1 Tax=Thermoflexus TaxID=1495649 RepID=UPI001C7423DB|nr:MULTISPECIES: porphobilinogen synthase [Thermoflexus]QWK10398.1 MAG: porphobilinogen synthase [Thermoflexus hugenholtzii]
MAQVLSSIRVEPIDRLRRLRRTEGLRALAREISLTPEDFIYPLFVRPGRNVREPISSMPGQFRLTVDRLEAEVEEIVRLGIRAVLLFGLAERKDPEAREAWEENGLVPQAIRRIKAIAPELVVITDVCVCAYTDHGHCGIVRDGRVDNDATLALLARMALAHAAAGADLVAPSAMMDGQVRAIREALDEAGFVDVGIMAYSAKFASAFYGPFREAADSAPRFGDRRSYQMDPPNAREALREIERDIAQGADIIMVKPALAYLDVIRRARERFDHPLAAYNVSGEYSMVKAAAQMGWLDEERAMMEILIAIKRAGADRIITYFAKEAARRLRR